MDGRAIYDTPVLVIGPSRQMVKVRRQITRLARLDTPVLIVGEAGCGARVVARAIHRTSSRAAKGYFEHAFGPIPAALLATEMFGYVRGAFRWAKRSHPGWLEEAQGGTILLRDLSQIPEVLIPGLLRAIRERVVCRIGDDRLIPIDVRVIVACTISPQTPRVDGWSRDLYRALSVDGRIQLPALRERPEDIPALARYFLRRHRNRNVFAQPISGFSSDALAALTHYSWPGNVLELNDVIERAVLFATTSALLCDDVRVF